MISIFRYQNKRHRQFFPFSFSLIFKKIFPGRWSKSQFIKLSYSAKVSGFKDEELAWKIGTNIPSLMLQRNLGNIRFNVSKELKGLASGSRINMAADDATGLAISETMRAKIRSKGMAMRNTNDAISLIQVAEGGLGEISSLLIRLRELAIQSSSDTAWDSDRNFANTECHQLKSEIQKIALSTEFNGMRCLSGTSGSLDFQIGSKHHNLARMSIDTKELESTLSALKIDKVNTLSKQDSRQSLERLDFALTAISMKRAHLGGIQNRLEKTMNNLNIQKENLAHANSRIKDTDVAQSVANLNKANLATRITANLLVSTNNKDRLALDLIL